jgi:hypothetical protein
MDVNLLHGKAFGSGTTTSEGNVNHIREAFQRSPRKSIRAASLQLQVTRSTVHDVLHKRLCLRAYEIQTIHALKLSDLAAHFFYLQTKNDPERKKSSNSRRHHYKYKR